MVDRRTILMGLVGAAGARGIAWAQTSERVYRIGWVPSFARPAAPGFTFRDEPYSIAFVQRLAELGFVDGRNLVFVRFDSHEAMGAALTRQTVDCLFAPGGESSVRAAAQAGRDTPVVFVANDYDPVATGHVASLARPGGRITGVAQLQSELPAKRLELLRQLLPKARRTAVFADGNTTGQLNAVQAAAKSLGFVLQVVEFTEMPYDYDRAFAEAARGKAEALLALASALFVPGRRRIPELALKHRLPSIFGNALWAEAGGLLAYGPNFSDIYRRAAELVAMILRGAKPADIPVEEWAKLELVLNLKTAKALGITFPESVRLRASRIVD